MPQKIFAFWSYDKFPFVIGDSVTPLSLGLMKTDHYGQYGTQSVIAYRPVQSGVEIQQQLKSLESELKHKIENLQTEYETKAIQILPELVLLRKFGGKIR